jgi:NDP-sugar pyrophosphorylase family protein
MRDNRDIFVYIEIRATRLPRSTNFFLSNVRLPTDSVLNRREIHGCQEVLEKVREESPCQEVAGEEVSVQEVCIEEVCSFEEGVVEEGRWQEGVVEEGVVEEDIRVFQEGRIVEEGIEIFEESIVVEEGCWFEEGCLLEESCIFQESRAFKESRIVEESSCQSSGEESLFEEALVEEERWRVVWRTQRDQQSGQHRQRHRLRHRGRRYECGRRRFRQRQRRVAYVRQQQLVNSSSAMRPGSAGPHRLIRPRGSARLTKNCLRKR